ncbi:hypothetical protein CYMTET_37472 [Cymbomonas tetramitiformis]|nr:hypothetical protein CYMTET_37472 [Cymbomonas tetramitiformis]
MKVAELNSSVGSVSTSITKWKDLFAEHFRGTDNTPVRDIQFDINHRRCGKRTHSFLVVFEDTKSASNYFGHQFTLEDTSFRCTRVANKSKKIELFTPKVSGAKTVTGIQIPVLNNIREQVTILRQDYRSFRLEHAVEKEYAASGGSLVNKEWSIRFSGVPLALEGRDLVDIVYQSLSDIFPNLLDTTEEEWTNFKKVLLDSQRKQPVTGSIAANEVRTWVIEFSPQAPEVPVLAKLKKIQVQGRQVKIMRLGNPSNGGRFYYITDLFRQAVQLENKAGNLNTSSGVITDLESLEFFDGTSVCGHSVTGGRIRFFSFTLFTSTFRNPFDQQPFSKLLRWWDVSCGETQSFLGPKLILDGQAKQECEALFAGMLPTEYPWPEALTVADIRILRLPPQILFGIGLT